MLAHLRSLYQCSVSNFPCNQTDLPLRKIKVRQLYDCTVMTNMIRIKIVEQCYFSSFTTHFTSNTVDYLRRYRHVRLRAVCVTPNYTNDAKSIKIITLQMQVLLTITYSNRLNGIS